MLLVLLHEQIKKEFIRIPVYHARMPTQRNRPQLVRLVSLRILSGFRCGLPVIPAFVHDPSP